ncbi:MAG: hypothetical protein MUO62_07565, partial [Anaerolineales bacterium]|nr:hypothetical protein [Anaerolineales bacterium]
MVVLPTLETLRQQGLVLPLDMSVKLLTTFNPGGFNRPDHDFSIHASFYEISTGTILSRPTCKNTN